MSYATVRRNPLAVEPKHVDIADGMTTVLMLDGEIQECITFFDYGIDEEGCAAGVFKYLVTKADRPVAGKVYNTMVLAWQRDNNQLVPILRVENVLIRAELGSITADDAGFEVECRWVNGGADA